MPTKPKLLTTNLVNWIYLNCELKDHEGHEEYIEVDGIDGPVRLHAWRTEFHQQTIHDMLDELPDEFKCSHGDGYSLASASVNHEGDRWSDDLRTPEKLVQLGIAIGEVEYLLPRDEWDKFKNGLPYFQVKM